MWTFVVYKRIKCLVTMKSKNKGTRERGIEREEGGESFSENNYLSFLQESFNSSFQRMEGASPCI